MKPLNSPAFALFLIFFISEPCHAFSQNEDRITDLESLDPAGFTNEANSWVWKGVFCPECIFTMPSGSSCDSDHEGQMIFGGPEATPGSAYFQKTYAPSSTGWEFALIGYEIWVFTTSEWSNAATLEMYKIFQNNIYGGGEWTLISSCSTDFVSLQGSHIKYIYKYSAKGFIYLGSSQNPITFGVQKSSWEAPASLDSIGIRDFKIYNPAPLTNSGTDNIPCAGGYRWTGTNCEGCHTTCQSCSGPGQDQCIACRSSYYDYGNSICKSTACSGPWEQVSGTMKCVKKCSTGFYWARNESCVENCEDPFVKSFDENGFSVCSSPCSDANKFVYPDGTCSGTCTLPLKDKIEPTLKLCSNPCQATGTGISPLFLYPDGSCVDTCPTYLDERLDNIANYCESTCGSEFIYPDSTCSPNCDSPFMMKPERGISACGSHCHSTKYLYADGSCDTCSDPMKKTTKKGVQYCENPCVGPQPFLYEDGTCQEACDSPRIPKDDSATGKTCQLPCANVNHYYNTQTGKCIATCEYPAEATESPLPKLCKSSLSEEEVKQVKALANTANNANTATSTGAMIWSVLSSSDSTSACLGPLAKMLQYIKFMDIMFPEKVLILMDAQSKDSGFATKMMKNVLKEFPSHELPRKFKVYQASSSFFVNFWPAFFNLLMILLVTGLVVVGTAKTKGRSKINGILKNLMEVLKWNVFLITFSGNVGDIVLYTSMEFQTVQFDSFAAVFSFMLCLGTNTFAVMVVMQILVVNSAVRKSKKQTKDEEEHKKVIEQEWSSYKALFECYKDYSFYQQVFLFVFLVRLALFNAMIGYLYNYPLFQATIAVISNILMLGYLVIKRPMKKVVSLIQQIVLELVLLPFNVCVLALAIMDHHEIADLDRRKSIGDVIVYINVIVPILSLVLMAIKAIAMGVDFYKSWKLAKANKVKKLASVQSVFRPNDILNTTEEKLCIQTVESADQLMISTGHHSVQSNLMMENHIIRPLQSNSMMNNYYDQNPIPIMTSQNFIAPEYQSSFQQQSQFPMGIMQQGTQGQHFQDGTQNTMPPQNNRRRINKKRRDHLQIQNHAFNGGIGSIE